jgi:uncharacterized protein (DUF58 family)
VDQLERDLGRLTAAGHEVVIFQLLDPNELAFTFDRAMLFQDAENRKDVYLDPEAVRPEYQRRLQAHTDGMENVCRKLGFAFLRVVTNQPLELALFDFLKSRRRRGKIIRRQNQHVSPQIASA